jgi:hypothetical protein
MDDGRPFCYPGSVVPLAAIADWGEQGAGRRSNLGGAGPEREFIRAVGRRCRNMGDGGWVRWPGRSKCTL